MVVNKANSFNLLPILTILSIGFLLILPALLNGSLNGHDLPLHLRWSQYFSSQFWRGELYPRWLMDMNAGFGSPTFFFYPPIPYYFTSIFHLLLVNPTDGWYPLILSTGFALAASGLTAYLWLQTICGQKAAWIASILYMIFPYHLAVDLYGRFSFAEYWTFIWIPLLFYFSKKIIEGHQCYIIGFGISYAFLAMTHLPTLVIFSIFPILYVLFMTVRRQRLKAFISLVGAMAIGIGLSAIFWLPALTTQKYVSLDSISQGDFFYANNFLFTLQSPGLRQDLWRYLEVMVLLTGALVSCSVLITLNNSLATSRRESNYWLTTAMLAIFMTTPWSRPIWEVLPMLQKVQFPWRFCTVLTVATTALLALAIDSGKPLIKLGRKKSLSLIALGLIILVLSAIQLWLHKIIHLPLESLIIAAIVLLLSWGFSSLKIPVNSLNSKAAIVGCLLITSLVLSSGTVIKGGLYKASNLNTPDQIRQRLEKEISKDAGEYRPQFLPLATYNSFFLKNVGKNYAKASVTTGQGSVSIQNWQPRKIILQTNGTTDIGLTLKQFYYPGWTAKIQGELRPLTVQPSQPDGLLNVGMIPSGKQEVIVTLKAGKEERVGQIISAVSGLITLFFLFWFWKGDRVRVNSNPVSHQI